MNDMSLKAKIRNIASKKNISASAVLQNYLNNRFLFRLAKSEYRERFIVKGGMLISSIIGVEQRTTMDLDTTIRNMHLEENSIREAFEHICMVPGDDGIQFVFKSIAPIRDDDLYGGYRILFNAVLGKINSSMSMDVTTGDAITPEAGLYEFSDMFDPDQKIQLLAYPIETVFAEKLETIMSRGVDNTRPRDFYDVYMLSAVEYDKDNLRLAFKATADHRESYNKILDYTSIIESIRNDQIMNQRWMVYQKQMAYAESISFGETLDAVKRLMDEVFHS